MSTNPKIQYRKLFASNIRQSERAQFRGALECAIQFQYRWMHKLCLHATPNRVFCGPVGSLPSRENTYELLTSPKPHCAIPKGWLLFEARMAVSC